MINDGYCELLLLKLKKKKKKKKGVGEAATINPHHTQAAINSGVLENY